MRERQDLLLQSIAVNEGMLGRSALPRLCRTWLGAWSLQRGGSFCRRWARRGRQRRGSRRILATVNLVISLAQVFCLSLGRCLRFGSWRSLALGTSSALGVDLALAFAFAEALAFALGLTGAAVVLDSTPSSVSASRFAGWLLLLPLPLPFFSCSLSPCFTRFRPLPFRAGESCLRARFWSSRVKNAATGDGGTSSLSARSGGDGCVKGISTPFSEAKGESTTVIATAGEPGQPGSWQIGCWVIPSPTFEGNFRTNLQTRSPLNTMTPTSAADAADGGLEACCFRSSSCCLR